MEDETLMPKPDVIVGSYGIWASIQNDTLSIKIFDSDANTLYTGTYNNVLSDINQTLTMIKGQPEKIKFIRNHEAYPLIIEVGNSRYPLERHGLTKLDKMDYKQSMIRTPAYIRLRSTKNQEAQEKQIVWNEVCQKMGIHLVNDSKEIEIESPGEYLIGYEIWVNPNSNGQNHGWMYINHQHGGDRRGSYLAPEKSGQITFNGASLVQLKTGDKVGLWAHWGSNTWVEGNVNRTEFWAVKMG